MLLAKMLPLIKRWAGEINSNLVLLLSSSCYAMLTLYPFRGWLRFTEFTKAPFPNIDIYKDSLYYLGQLREILNGNYSLGNPLIFEHVKDGFSYGNSSLFYVWGSLGNLLNLELVNLYLIMIIINSFLLVLFLAKFFQIFIDSKSTPIFALFISILFIGPLGRPSPTQQLLPILIFSLNVVLAHNKRQKFTNIFFILSVVILVSGNPYYALFLLIVSVLAKLVIHKKDILYLFVSMIITLVYFAWTRINFDAQDELIASRLGMHHTRIPGAVKITIPTIILLFIFIIVHRAASTKIDRISVDTKIKINKCLILLFALLCAVNSQIFTGIALEMESHFAMIWYIVAGASVLILYLIFLELSRLNSLKYLESNLIHTSLILSFLIYLVPQFTVIQVKSTAESKIIENIRLDKTIKTILIKDSSMMYELRNQFIYLTDAYLYWGKGAEFSRMSDTDISRRFTCTQTNILSKSEFLNSFYSTPPRNLVNQNQKLESLGRLFNLLGLEFNLVEKLEQTYNYNLVNYETYLEHVRECSTEKFRFKVDKILY